MQRRALRLPHPADNYFTGAPAAAGTNAIDWPTVIGDLGPLLAIYFVTRLWRLGALAMFIDEGMYISWSLQALHARRALDTLVSVTDGKQPLFPWLMAPLLAALPDRLFAARLTSVLAGAAGVTVT